MKTKKKKNAKRAIIRVSAEAHAALKKMAREEGRSVIKVLDIVLGV